MLAHFWLYDMDSELGYMTENGTQNSPKWLKFENLDLWILKIK